MNKIKQFHIFLEREVYPIKDADVYELYRQLAIKTMKKRFEDLFKEELKDV